SVPVVDLPLGATEDRVCGTINIERALKESIKAFEPGLLARANRGFLYIDEVNLLEDHLIDLLLDVAVTGRNIVEREGVSIEHPARFVLVGSGNPEEGELRPQLLDRFGLQVEVKTVADLDERVSIVERREAFERDAQKFRSSFQRAQDSLRRRLIGARKSLHAVKLSRATLRRIAELCQQLNVDGHRGELIIARAARALAAFEGRKDVTDEDVRRVAAMALRHRLRRDPLEQSSGGQRIEQQLDKLFHQDENNEATAQAKDAREPDRPAATSAHDNHDEIGSASKQLDEDGKGDGSESNAPPPLDASLPDDSFDSIPRAQQRQAIPSHSTRRNANASQSSYNTRRGRYTRSTSIKTAEARIALDATLRATVGSRQLAVGSCKSERRTTDNGQLTTDLRYKRFKRKSGMLFIFAIDTSGSMALNRIAQAKGALVRLLQESYIKRDRVAIVSFRGQNAEILLPPSGSVARARRLLDELSIGGATPLAAGLASALRVAANARRQGTERIALLLFTDGRANVPLRMNGKLEDRARRLLIEEELKALGASVQQSRMAAFVVETQNRFTSSGDAERLASVIGARYVYLGAQAARLH
ncbi:MAG TPA: VWA domain-containing protein, partial [Pyrinomonadaceae bacterium]|nr:VWA domain-containing protein [Pyrinomonadaceae bacterium]